MHLQRLVIDGLRNLSGQRLDLDPSINWLFGVNGSGKTSVLEAIHVLGLGRSFRGRADQRVLIQDGREALTLFAEVIDDAGHQHRLGVEKRHGQGTTVRIDGDSGCGIAELARRLPLILIDPQSHQLIAGSPNERRAFLDWGVFHVEPSFLQRWRQFRRLLSQRNALLRQRAPERAIVSWDRELVPLAQWLTSVRQAYLESFLPLFSRYAREQFGLDGIELLLRPGWKQGEDYGELLTRQLAGDRDSGHTRQGPQRADLRILLNGQPAAERVSRGQQKLLAAALRLAQGAHFTAHRGEGCVLLVDDLPAELDHVHRRALFDALRDSGHQVFITATHPPSTCDDAEAALADQGRRFAVAAGTVTATEMVQSTDTTTGNRL